jgi:hypothetical protein
MNMNRKKLFLAAMLFAVMTPLASATIENVELRVEGMT